MDDPVDDQEDDPEDDPENDPEDDLEDLGLDPAAGTGGASGADCPEAEAEVEAGEGSWNPPRETLARSTAPMLRMPQGRNGSAVKDTVRSICPTLTEVMLASREDPGDDAGSVDCAAATVAEAAEDKAPASDVETAIAIAAKGRESLRAT